MDRMRERCGWLLIGACAAAAFGGDAATDPAWLATTAILWGLAVACPPEVHMRPGLAAWMIWVAWSGVCAGFSGEPWMSLSEWWRIASCAMALHLAGGLWDGSHRRAWPALLAAAGGAAAIANLWRPGPSWTQGLAAAGAAAVLGWSAGEDGPEGAAGLLGAAALVGLVLCASPGGAVSGAVGAAAALWLAFGSRRLVAGAAAAAAVGSWLRGGAGGLFGDYSNAVLAVVQDHPVTGIGPGLLARGLLRHPAAVAGAVAAHAAPIGTPSWLVRAAAETGVFGLGLYAWALARSLPAGLRRMDAAGRAGASAFVAVAAYSWSADILSGPLLPMVMFLSLSAAMSAGRLGEARAADIGPPLRLPRWAAAAGFAVCLLAWTPQEVLRRAQAEVVSADGGRRRAGLEVALSVAPGDASFQARLAREVLVDSPSRIGEALWRVREASELEPFNAVYLGRRAALFAVVGDWPRAAGAAREALALEPNFLGARLILAEAAVHAGAPREAAAYLGEARRLRGRLLPRSPYEAELADFDEDRARRVAAGLGGHG